MSHASAAAHDSDESIERMARKRVSLRLGWIHHALIYVLVNSVLAALSLSSGRYWAIFPIVGWGLGLLIHGITVLVALPGGGLHERLLRQERERLAGRRDPW